MPVYSWATGRPAFLFTIRKEKSYDHLGYARSGEDRRLWLVSLPQLPRLSAVRAAEGLDLFHAILHPAVSDFHPRRIHPVRPMQWRVRHRLAECFGRADGGPHRAVEMWLR